jgi:2-polyprenyl-6-methoxyphenol hydroxylase-like FAD-dependent oxidoreductase
VTARTADEGEPSQGFFEAALERCLDRSPERLEVHWMSAFRVNCRLAARCGEDRVLPAGDAAHSHSPIGGQGINIGMHNGFNRAAKLAGALDGVPGDPLTPRDAERRPRAATVIRSNARITRLAMSRGAVPRLLRDHLMPGLLRLPPERIGPRLEASGLR